MSSVLSSGMAHSAPTEKDMDILSLLISEQSALGPLSSYPQPFGSENVKQGRRIESHKDGPMDALLLSAVLAGSSTVTRHHFGHGIARPGAYASCDEATPLASTSRHAPRLVIKSTQAPRSERLRMEREARAALEKKSKEDTTVKSSGSDSVLQSHDQRHLSLDTFSPSASAIRAERPGRRLSIDPMPISQALQKASSSAYNHLYSPHSAKPQPGRIQVRCMARTRVPTPHGELFLHLYHNSYDSKEHLAIVMDPIQLDEGARASAPKERKEIRSKSLDAVWHENETEMERIVRGAYTGRLLPGATTSTSYRVAPDKHPRLEGMADVKTLVRIHSECFTGETIGSMRCDCGEQLDEAIHQISQPQFLPSAHSSPPQINILPTPAASRPETPSFSHNAPVPGRGVVIYLRQEGRGIGLLEKIRAYNLQDLGHDTVTANLMLGHGADERKYDIAAEMLRDLGLADEGIRLLTNNPEKVHGLASEGIKVVERVGMIPRDWQCGDDHMHNEGKEEGEDEKEEEYLDWMKRRAGIGLIGAGKASGPELEKYLRTKVERMGHLIDIPNRV
ncbi:GTP cyclohydrolase II [Cryptococcus depauperatus CBS 7841]|uniref:GTP cyclohydrolase II n=1 Tax=Cryptococcus depauperatus CBS 7841 TaxID=1295531 RepID=A0AAJ8JXT8_9TREE